MDKINDNAALGHFQGIMIARQDRMQNYVRLIAGTFDTDLCAE